MILLGVGGGGSAQQGDAQDVPAAREAVLALRQNSDSVSVLTQVCELRHGSVRSAEGHARRMFDLVTADFKFGNVPRRVLVCRSLNVSELRLVRSVVVVDVKRKLDYHTTGVSEARPRLHCPLHFRNS